MDIKGPKRMRFGFFFAAVTLICGAVAFVAYAMWGGLWLLVEYGVWVAGLWLSGKDVVRVQGGVVIVWEICWIWFYEKFLEIDQKFFDFALVCV